MNWEGHKKMNLSHVEELLTKVQVEHKPGYLRRVIQVWSAQNRNAIAQKIVTKFHNTRWENTVYNLKEGKFQKLRSIRGEGKNTIQLSPRRTDDNAVRSPYHISFSESLEQQIQDDDESERSKIAIDFPDFVLLVCLLEQAEFLEKSYFLRPLSGKEGAESDSYDDSESGSDFEKERDGEEEEDHEDEEKQRKIELTKEESVRMRLKAYRLGLKRSLKKGRVAASASIGHRANAASHALRKLRLLAKRFRMRAENRLMNVQEKLFEGSNRVIGEIKI